MWAALTMAGRPGVHAVHRGRVQACGDAHLSTSAVRQPERRIIFSDQRSRRDLPAWEWDVKPHAASFMVACRDQGPDRRRREGRGHDQRPRLPRVDGRVQRMKTLELWY